MGSKVIFGEPHFYLNITSKIKVQIILMVSNVIFGQTTFTHQQFLKEIKSKVCGVSFKTF